MDVSGYVGHVTIQLNAYHCLLFSSRPSVRVTVRIRFSVLLVNDYAHVFMLLSVVIVPYPNLDYLGQYKNCWIHSFCRRSLTPLGEMDRT